MTGLPVKRLSDRGQRSRNRLKKAALEMLNQKGFHSLRVQDVTRQAGVASGLFYHYFHDLREVVVEVASNVLAGLVEETAELVVPGHSYDWIYQNQTIVVRTFAGNPGVLACSFGLAGDYPEFGALWKDAAHQWNLQVAAFLSRVTSFEPRRARRMAYVLGAMMEGVVYQALIRHTEDLYHFGREPEDIAEVCAVMWYRAIFLEEPPVDKLRRAGRELCGPTPT